MFLDIILCVLVGVILGIFIHFLYDKMKPFNFRKLLSWRFFFYVLFHVPFFMLGYFSKYIYNYFFGGL